MLAIVVPSGANAATAARVDQAPAEANGLGQLSGLLPRDHLTQESAIQVNLSNETVRLPLYPGIAYKGTPHQEKVWYVLLDASDGLAHDLGVNYAPKLADIAISDPAAVLMPGQIRREELAGDRLIAGTQALAEDAPSRCRRRVRWRPCVLRYLAVFMPVPTTIRGVRRWRLVSRRGRRASQGRRPPGIH